MKTYKINASYRVHVHAYVQADSIDQALEIAHDMDGGDFDRDRGDDLADWSIDDAKEVQND